MSMPSAKKKTPSLPESKRQATWIREHPTVGTSKFPDYPDEAKRRGSSRGALPNGNPWKPESADERPGPRWTQPASSSDEARPKGSSEPEVATAGVTAPPERPVPVARIAPTKTGQDEAIAETLSERLAESKVLEGERVNVEVRADEVVLRGGVATWEARFEAEHIASSVRGVARVDNRIRVAPAKRR